MTKTIILSNKHNITYELCNPDKNITVIMLPIEYNLFDIIVKH